MFEVKGSTVHNQAELCNISSKTRSKCKNETQKCMRIMFACRSNFTDQCNFWVMRSEMSSDHLQNVWKYHHYSFEYIVSNAQCVFTVQHSVFCTTNEGRLWFFIIVSQHGIGIIMNHVMQDTTERTVRGIKRRKKWQPIPLLAGKNQ